jgi:hypothetical protein
MVSLSSRGISSTPDWTSVEQISASGQTRLAIFWTAINFTGLVEPTAIFMAWSESIYLN